MKLKFQHGNNTAHIYNNSEITIFLVDNNKAM